MKSLGKKVRTLQTDLIPGPDKVDHLIAIWGLAQRRQRACGEAPGVSLVSCLPGVFQEKWGVRMARYL